MRLFYFAYGSNLHPARLGERVGGLEIVGRASAADHRLAFHKRGADGSGKCDMVHAAGGAVHGALYRLDRDQLAALDRFEGAGRGYRRRLITVQAPQGPVVAWTYFAAPDHTDPSLAPYGWYQALVVAGARHHRLPPSYVAALERIAHWEDPNVERDAAHRRLLALPA